MVIRHYLADGSVPSVPIRGFPAPPKFDNFYFLGFRDFKDTDWKVLFTDLFDCLL
jgi:hypothetical protein